MRSTLGIVTLDSTVLRNFRVMELRSGGMDISGKNKGEAGGGQPGRVDARLWEGG